MRPTITLVDGYKDGGRSEVARALADHLEAYHFIGTRSTTPGEYVQAMQLALDDIQPVVIERSWQFERYCLVIGKGSNIRTEHARMLDRLALARDGYLIKCCPPLEYILDIAAGRKATEAEIFQLAANCQAWTDFPVPLPVMSFEEVEDPELILGGISDISSNAGPGIGLWYPEHVIMLVGDSHGPSKQPYKVNLNIAFCDMAKIGSSFWLASQLEKRFIPEHKLYWVNAKNTDKTWADSSFYEKLKPTAVYAMGGVADQWCIRNDIKSVRVAHPQYQKRFHPHEPYDLIDRLAFQIRAQ